MPCVAAFIAIFVNLMSCYIPFRAQNFSSLNLTPPSSGTLKTNWPEVVYAGITVGRASLSHVNPYGRYSSFEILHKIALIFAYLKGGPKGRLLRTAPYDGLDPSEKSGVSYFLGLMSAQLFSSRLLGVRYLSHLDVYKNFPDPRYRLDPEFFYGGKKPDLVGQNASGDWVAIEAKGRTNRFEPWVIQSAKTQQLANLRSINSIPPSLKVALMAYFEDGVLNVHLEDPETSNDEAQNLNLPEKEVYIKHWYEPFINLMKHHEHRVLREGESEYLVVDFNELDAIIGVDRRIYDSHQRGLPTIAGHLAPGRKRQTDHGLIGDEGIFLELGAAWNSESMMNEPYLRNLQ